MDLKNLRTEIKNTEKGGGKELRKIKKENLFFPNSLAGILKIKIKKTNNKKRNSEIGPLPLLRLVTYNSSDLHFYTNKSPPVPLKTVLSPIYPIENQFSLLIQLAPPFLLCLSEESMREPAFVTTRNIFLLLFC